ncbi:MAG: hypothetical protein ACKVTZ_07200, partial [Bacteroidia bacterium]
FSIINYPLLMIKISNITDLQDARYCAAVNFSYISFDLKKGSPSFQTPEAIRQIAAWVTGVKFVIETNAESNDLLAEIYPTFPFDYMGLREEDWGKLTFLPPYPVILRTSSQEITHLQGLLQVLPPDSLLEIEIEKAEQIVHFQTIANRCLFIAPNLAQLVHYLKKEGTATGNFSLYEAALFKEGGLDYEVLDDLVDALACLKTP